jgi:CBS-domain-containing membrane protein
MNHRRIKNVMTTDVATVSKNTPFKDVVRILDHRNVSALPVLDAAGRVIGIVSQADLLPKQGAQEPSESHSPVAWFQRHWDRARAGGTTAGELMSTPVHAIGPDDTVVAAAKLLDRYGVKRLPVVDADGMLLGIVSRRDLLTVFLRSDADIAAEIAEYVFERNLDTVVNPSTVSVDVRDGVVTLRGALERKSMVPIAGTLTSRVDGVVDVHNDLTYTHDDTHLRVPDPMVVDITHEPWLKT